jgi:hypothetical protein
LRSVLEAQGAPVFINPRTNEPQQINAQMLKGLKLMPYGAGLYVLADSSGNLAAAGDLRTLPDGSTFYEMRQINGESISPYVLDFSRVTK